MFLIIDGTNNEPELVNELSRQDLDDADMEIITIINLVGTPKKDTFRYIKGGSWTVIPIRQ